MRERIRRFALLALGTMVATTSFAAVAHAKAKSGSGGPVKVMTYNAGLGSGLSARFAPNLDELCEKAGENVREVDATNPPLRMRGIAKNILAENPDLVGLQEADALFTQTPPDNGPLLGGTDATTVRYDFVDLILDELNKGKKRYELLTVHEEFEFETKANVDGIGYGCDGSETDVRLVTQNALLKRVGAGVKTSRLRQDSYRYQLSFDLLGSVPYAVPRGWESVDARVRGGKKFRFVHTHLEAFDNNPSSNAMLDTSTEPPTESTVANGEVREAQASELVDGPAKGKPPVILLGDLNSNVPGVKPGDEKAFQRILEAGFKRRSTQKPPSCCGDTIAEFDHVVDHVMAKPSKKVKLVSSSVVGRKPFGGMLPSDHAGVVSELKLK